MENIKLTGRNIVFFDGVCHLCNGFVDAVISQDKKKKFYFAALQGETARELLPAEDRDDLDTVVYYEAGKLYRRSAAVIKILSGLGGIYSLAKIGLILPAPLRDLLYNFIAKNRYAWFGTRDFCRLPTTQEREYLLP